MCHIVKSEVCYIVLSVSQKFRLHCSYCGTSRKSALVPTPLSRIAATLLVAPFTLSITPAQKEVVYHNYAMSIDFPKEEEAVLARWKEIKAFERQVRPKPPPPHPQHTDI